MARAGGACWDAGKSEWIVRGVLQHGEYLEGIWIGWGRKCPTEECWAEER